MIAIFDTLLKAQEYSNRVHTYLTQNRPNYNAVKWADPVQSADGLKWWVKVPHDMEGQTWEEPVPTTEISQAIDTTIPLPESGQIQLNKYYLFKGDIVKCIQAHTRTEWEPKDTPALFVFFRDNSDQLQWVENEQIQIGWERIYLTIRYKCIQPHTTVEGQTPNLTPALWNVIVTTEAWTVGVLYHVNDLVTYLGNTYKCLQQHTAIQSWNPVAVLNILWKLK